MPNPYLPNGKLSNVNNNIPKKKKVFLLNKTIKTNYFNIKKLVPPVEPPSIMRYSTLENVWLMTERFIFSMSLTAL